MSVITVDSHLVFGEAICKFGHIYYINFTPFTGITISLITQLTHIDICSVEWVSGLILHYPKITSGFQGRLHNGATSNIVNIAYLLWVYICLCLSNEWHSFKDISITCLENNYESILFMTIYIICLFALVCIYLWGVKTLIFI